VSRHRGAAGIKKLTKVVIPCECVAAAAHQGCCATARPESQDIRNVALAGETVIERDDRNEHPRRSRRSARTAKLLGRDIERSANRRDRLVQDRTANRKLSARMLFTSGRGRDPSSNLLEEIGAAEEDLSDELTPWRMAGRRGFDETDVLLTACLCGAEFLEETVDCQPGLSPLQACCLTIAAPAPLASMRDQPGPDGVEHNVARKLEQVGFSLHQDSLEASLKEMSAAVVPAIEVLRVAAIEPVHATREVGLGCLHDEVIVVGHQDKGEQLPSEAHNGLAQHLNEPFTIVIVAEDVPALVSARSEVPKREFEFESERSCHTPPRLPRDSSFPIRGLRQEAEAGADRAQYASKWKFHAW
jgi:hypothetical protein